jgi:hypothetical protein
VFVSRVKPAAAGGVIAVEEVSICRMRFVDSGEDCCSCASNFFVRRRGSRGHRLDSVYDADAILNEIELD